MAMNLSVAKSLKNFFDKLGPTKNGDDRSVRKAICLAYGIAEDSSETDLLIYVQAENFRRLMSQVDLSTIEVDAKKTYRGQVQSLSRCIRHPILYGRYEQAKKDFISPNYNVLTYLNDALKVSIDITDETSNEIAGLVDSLKEALDSALVSSLPLRLKNILDVQISQLIFLIKNFDSVGVDKAWELASAAFLTIQREAPKVNDVDEKGIFKKIAVGVAAVVGALAMADAGLNHSVSIATNMKAGYELVEQWRRDQIPKIEHRKSVKEKEEKE
jgi:hypothetical protein